MKSLLLVALGLLNLAPLSARLAGDWSGDLNFPQGKLRFVFHITGTDDDLSATADSPDQNARNLPVDSIRLRDDTLTFRMTQLNARFTGEVAEDRIRGTFSQNGVDVPLLLTRGSARSRNDESETKARSGTSAIAGNWAGVLRFPQGNLRIILHISGSDSDLDATADSPDQNATGLPVDSIARSGQTLRFAMNRLNARFEGTIAGDTIRGTFNQNGSDVPLTLQRQ
jgi:uncharacterized protein